MTAGVFISHVQEDAHVAAEIVRGLATAGHRVWRYEGEAVSDPTVLATIKDAIGACDVFLLLASSLALRSTQIAGEVSQASEASKAIVALVIGLSQDEFLVQRPDWPSLSIWSETHRDRKLV